MREEVKILLKRSMKFEKNATWNIEQGDYDLAIFHIEQAKQDAIKMCEEIGGNMTPTVKIFVQLKSKMPVEDPEYTFYKIRNTTKTLYQVCVVGKKVYIPICEFRGCEEFGECGIEEYHCFAPERVEAYPLSTFPWTIRYNASFIDYSRPYPKKFFGVDPRTLRFHKLRYVGNVYSGEPLGEEIVKEER